MRRRRGSKCTLAGLTLKVNTLETALSKAEKEIASMKKTKQKLAKTPADVEYAHP